MISAAESTSYVFKDFRVDAEKRLLLGYEDVPVALKPKVFDTLFYLVRHSGKLIEKDELMSAVWPDTIVEENNLNKNISALRHALGENPHDHHFIVTVPGKGYKFVAPVEVIAPAIEPVTNGSADVVPAMHISMSRESAKPGRFWFVILAMATLAGLSFIGFYSLRESETGSPIKSIAVLPFVNAGADPEMDYLSDGLSESLIDRLSELRDLKVIARSSSFKYRGENLDLQDVAAKLGVHAIVTGRLSRRSDNLTIRVDLVDARNNRQLWGGEFSRNVKDALELEGAIARPISDKLNLISTGSQSKPLFDKGTDDPKAYELVLKGDFLEKTSSLDNRMKAIEYYRQAIAIDPKYARAYAQLSHTYGHLAGDSLLDPKEAHIEARAAAQKAIELDANLADAHLELANLARNSSWDWATAEREYVRSLELNPNFAEARNRYCNFLSVIGKHNEAIEQARLLRELDPEKLTSHLALPFALLATRQFDEAISESRKILELDGDFVGAHCTLGLGLAGKGMYRESLATYQEVARLNKGKLPYFQISLGAAYARAGDYRNAQAILRRLETSAQYVSPGELAILYVALGEHEKAFASLDKAFSARDLQLQALFSFEYDPLRDDPRFQDLVRRVGVSQ